MPGTRGNPWWRWAIAGELPVDGLRRHGDGTWEPFSLTTPTDIASLLVERAGRRAVEDHRPEEADGRLERTLGSLERLERAHGFFYDRLDPRTGRAR